MKLPCCRWPYFLAVGLAALLLVPFNGIVWDGGFDSAEFRLQFADRAGRPIQGVTLHVETVAGGTSYYYPVNEFFPSDRPTSDAEGKMVFHHVANYLEFSGREHSNLVGMRSGETKTPQYVCVFSLDGRELSRITYDDLRGRGRRDNLPSVTRTWRQPKWAWREWMAWREDLKTNEKRRFDGNGDGVIDREEAVAANYFWSKLVGDSPEREEKEVTYTIHERRVEVPVP